MSLNKFSIMLVLAFSFYQCTPQVSETVIDSQANTDKAFHSDEGCPDLVIEKVEIIKKTKSKVFIAYTIKNQGDAVAPIFGTDAKSFDNIAFKIYFSSDEKMNRGDILVDGYYLEDKVLANGLGVGETYTGEMKLSLKGRTSFTPNLILNIDAWQTLNECDEKNNVFSIVL